MTFNWCQLTYRSLSDEDCDDSHLNKCLYPYPSGVLESKEFSLGRISTQPLNSNQNSYEIELRIVSPIKFSVESSGCCQHFDNIFSNDKLKIYYKSQTKYELNIKHFVYVLSRIKDCQEEGSATFSYNCIDRDLVNELIKNVCQNDNIISFICSNNNCKKSIIQSLKYDKQFGKSAEFMFKSKVFSHLKRNQLEAFYMGIIRNGKCILADENGGKSLEAITIMTYFQKDWPLLIVCNNERKIYWTQELDKWVPTIVALGHKLRISAINQISDIFTYPNPFHDIMIISYEIYYEVKDTISFRQLNIVSFIFEDRLRGKQTYSRQWKGLSQCCTNLESAKRICFIWSVGVHFKHPKALFPLLNILNSVAFNHFGEFNDKYCEERESQTLSNRRIKLCELEIILRSTLLIRSITINDNK